MGAGHRRSVNNGTTWSNDTLLVNQNAQFSSLAVSGSVVHLVWEDNRAGNFEIYYKRNPTGNSGLDEFCGPNVQGFGVGIKSFPNPFTSFATVPGHSSDLFALYDVSGRKVGVYKGDRIASDLGPGVYFLREEGKNGKPVRVVKLK